MASFRGGLKKKILEKIPKGGVSPNPNFIFLDFLPKEGGSVSPNPKGFYQKKKLRIFRNFRPKGGGLDNPKNPYQKKTGVCKKGVGGGSPIFGQKAKNSFLCLPLWVKFCTSLHFLAKF